MADEQLHAQFLANKVVALGGNPPPQPRPVPVANTNREMLAAVLAAERQATQVTPSGPKKQKPMVTKGWPSS